MRVGFTSLRGKKGFYTRFLATTFREKRKKKMTHNAIQIFGHIVFEKFHFVSCFCYKSSKLIRILHKVYKNPWSLSKMNDQVGFSSRKALRVDTSFIQVSPGFSCFPRHS
jgi:hypothetical protein